MNDFVLRGFCKKCDTEVFLYDTRAMHCAPNGSLCEDGKYSKEPVWFLSAQQMDIITSSKEFAEFIEINEVDCWINPHDALAEFLKENPFLVSRILKEAGEKNKEENK